MEPAEKPGRVLLLLTELFANGGIQRFNQTLLGALETLGVECDVLTLHDSPETIQRRPLDGRIAVTGFRGRRLMFAIATLRAVWTHRYAWVVVGHANLLSMTATALATNPWARARTVMVAHGIEIWYGIGRSTRFALHRLSRILCVSGYTRRRILEQVPTLDAARLRIFPNALGRDWNQAGERTSRTRPARRFLLSVTRLHRGDRYKGVVTVIETLGMLEDTSLHYVIVGQGDDQEFLRSVASRCGVRDRVHFMGGVKDEELTDLYAQCEAFVLPSGKEGFGIVFLEAMFFGAPVIAAAAKGALDVVRQGETGLLVRFGDTVALKAAIARLCSDTNLREHLRRAGRSSVVAGGAFAFSRFVERTAEVLEMAHGDPA
jgi:glycosyltransferase involved in cell wall biosynthesis